jgi:electron transfer flavoprotein alpha subunit
MSDVLAIAEHRRSELRDVSLELLSVGQSLVNGTGNDLHTAIIGGDVDRYAQQLDRGGVGVVHTVGYGEEFNHDVYVQAVEQLVEYLDPEIILLPHTVDGMDYAPAVANRIDAPIVTDVVDVCYDDSLTVTREMYGSKVETDVAVTSKTAVVTVRPAEWPQAKSPGAATIRPFDVDIDEAEIGSTVTGFEDATSGGTDITDADVLVAVGRGIEDEEHLDLVFELAEVLDATVAASRPVVDNGWLPSNRQVGQSGKVVSPDVYLAIGISGAVQHVTGMKQSDTIVAINTDPGAPIFDIADYGIVDDLFDVVPALIAAYRT